MTGRRGGALVALLFLSLAGGAAAQQPVQSVIGVVRDTAGAPLPGASVSVGVRETVTNAQGAFRLDSVRVGTHLLTIRSIGHTPLRTRIVVMAREPVRLDFSLFPAAVVLAPLIVEARRTGIYGVVGNMAHDPLPGATVQVLGAGGGRVLTDSLGRFAFPQADRGTYMVRVTGPGFAERWLTLTMNRGEGREFAVRLGPATRPPARVSAGTLADLSRRLAFGLSRARLSAGELDKYGTHGLCDIAQIRGQLRTSSTINLILNGETVYRTFPVVSLCAWSADEVELVEFGGGVCAEVTHTLAQLLGIWCGGFRGGPSYIAIWEKR